MARISRITEYAKSFTKEQASGPALSIKDRLSQMKEKSKEMSKKTDKTGKEGN